MLASGIVVAVLASEERPTSTGPIEVPSPSRPERLNESRGDLGDFPPGPATVDTDLIRSGGPPPDGIPPIDEPRFLDPAEVRGLVAQEPVISVEVNDEAKAYPVRILMWHEIVNDEIGGEPVTVTYCPLCNTGVAFRRPVIDGELLDFGTSGRLYHSNLVMYDRQTGTFWSQATLEAIVGPLAGRRLEFVPAQIVSWADWRAAHPAGLVLSQDTGFDKAYGQNPYQGYDSPENGDPFLFTGDPDPRLRATARVLGVSAEGESMAFPYDEISRFATGGFSAAQARVGMQEVVVFWKRGTASALDQPEIAASRDVGSATAYEPRSGEMLLHFEAGPGGFVDRETRSRWDVFGRAVAGPLQGTRLRPLPAVDHFWFSWAAFFPDTVIYRR
ncbi:MAG: DUF3179 domain-containing protein [Actinomycetota bacterium]